MILIDKQDRSVLIEGRNWGLGFAFCKREGDTYTTVQPISPCKDFLNDVVYSEWTGKPFSVWGLKTKKEGIFDKDLAYVAMGILPYNRQTTKHKDHDAMLAGLAAMVEHESLINCIEQKLVVPATAIFSAGNDRFIAHVPIFWAMATYRISLWSLLMRVGLKYKGGDPIEFLKQVKDDDSYMVQSIMPKLERMIGGEIPTQDLDKLTDVHNCGIVSFSFPTKTKSKSP